MIVLSPMSQFCMQENIIDMLFYLVLDIDTFTVILVQVRPLRSRDERDTGIQVDIIYAKHSLYTFRDFYCSPGFRLELFPAFSNEKVRPE